MFVSCTLLCRSLTYGGIDGLSSTTGRVPLSTVPLVSNATLVLADVPPRQWVGCEGIGTLAPVHGSYALGVSSTFGVSLSTVSVLCLSGVVVVGRGCCHRVSMGEEGVRLKEAGFKKTVGALLCGGGSWVGVFWDFVAVEERVNGCGLVRCHAPRAGHRC